VHAKLDIQETVNLAAILMSAPPVCAAVTVHEPHAQTQQDPTIALVTILTQEMEELVILWQNAKTTEPLTVLTGR